MDALLRRTCAATDPQQTVREVAMWIQNNRRVPHPGIVPAGRTALRSRGRSQWYALSGGLKTGLLLLALAGLAALVGLVLFGVVGVVLAVASVGVLALVGLRLPPAWVMRMQGAVPLSPWQAPRLHGMVARLATRARVPSPTLHLISSPTANAMTTGGGSQRGALAITEGALRLLDDRELEGVLAHEIAHLRARDTSIQQAAGMVSRSVTVLLEVAIWTTLFGALLGGVGAGRMVLMMVLAVAVPPAVGLLQAALSRTREFAADQMAAELTGNPLALARALRKLSLQTRSWFGGWLRPAAEAPLLRSHPATGERIRRLVELADDPDAGAVSPLASTMRSRGSVVAPQSILSPARRPRPFLTAAVPRRLFVPR